MRMSTEEYKNLIAKKKTSKYRNKPCIINDIYFRSTWEGECYEKCKAMQKAGEIEYFIRQPMFDLGGGTKHYSDFLLVPKGLSLPIIDAKGCETDMFKLKKKQVEAAYPIEITLWKK